MTGQKTNVKFNRKLSILLLTIVGAFCILMAGILGFSSAFAQDSSLAEVTINDYYFYGQTFEVPEGKIDIGGTQVNASAIVFYPDGSAVNSNSIVLNQLGKYTVQYTAVKDNVEYKQEKQFNVYKYMFSNQQTNAGAKYGYHEYYPEDPGVMFSIAQDEVLVFNDVVDLTDNTKYDSLFKIAGTPLELGSNEAGKHFIKITDKYDPTIYVTLRNNQDPGDNKRYAYLCASFGTNPYAGWSGETFYFNHNTYGSGNDAGLIGPFNGSVPLDIRFDYQTQTFYQFHRNEIRKVANLNEDYGEAYWPGFTTGEVYISFYVTGYNTSSAINGWHGMVMELDELDLSEGVLPDGTVPPVVIKNAPDLNIEFGDYQYNIPHAMVGYPYDLFDYNYTSVHGNERVITSVYYGYNTSSRYEVPVVDNAFVPNNVGTYTIVYTLIDSFGNQTTEKVDVYAEKYNGSGFTLTVPNYNQHLSGKVGEVFDLVRGDDLVFVNNFGNVTVSIIAKHSSGYQEDVSNVDFAPKLLGEWDIIYTGKDYSGRTGSFSYSINISQNENVVFTQIKDLPKYFIVGARNKIPTLNYIDYNVGLNENVVENVYVLKAGVPYQLDSEGYYTPLARGEHTIVYEATSSLNVVTKKQIVIEAVDVDFGKISYDLSKYFQSDDILARDVFARSVSFTLDTNGKADFIRDVAAETFNISLKIDSEFCASNKVSMYLTDINNKKQVLKFSILNVDGVMYISLNDAKPVELKNYSYTNMDVGITFDAGYLTVSDRNILVDKYLDGSEYKGFDSLTAFLTFECENTAEEVGATQIYINEINGQKFYDSQDDYEDAVGPKVIAKTRAGGRLLVGDVFVVNPAKIIDVLDPYTTGKLTVVGPDGNPVVDNYGLTLRNVPVDVEYKFTAVIPGMYFVQYTYQDSLENGSARPRGEGYNIISLEKPEIIVNTSTASARVGDTIVARDATVTSESASEINLCVYVRGPHDGFDVIKNGEKFADKGTYVIRYVAVDEFGNLSFAEYKILVS